MKVQTNDITINRTGVGDEGIDADYVAPLNNSTI